MLRVLQAEQMFSPFWEGGRIISIVPTYTQNLILCNVNGAVVYKL